MLAAIAIVPSAPVLVPELAGAAAAVSPELADLRAAVRTAVSELPPWWIAIGGAAHCGVYGPDAGGNFGGFGVDLPVTLCPETHNPGDIDLPLCALMAGWMRDRMRPDAAVEVRVFGNTDTATAVNVGRRLRSELDGREETIGVLVVADGANTLSASAPGGYHPEHAAGQRSLDDALAQGDVPGLVKVADSVAGGVGFGVLAGLAAPGPRVAKELYRGAPYGVGYFVGVWRP